jgi:hypothetical protein
LKAHSAAAALQVCLGRSHGALPRASNITSNKVRQQSIPNLIHLPFAEPKRNSWIFFCVLSFVVSVIPFQLSESYRRTPPSCSPVDCSCVTHPLCAFLSIVRPNAEHRRENLPFSLPEDQKQLEPKHTPFYIPTLITTTTTPSASHTVFPSHSFRYITHPPLPKPTRRRPCLSHDTISGAPRPSNQQKETILSPSPIVRFHSSSLAHPSRLHFSPTIPHAWNAASLGLLHVFCPGSPDCLHVLRYLSAAFWITFPPSIHGALSRDLSGDLCYLPRAHLAHVPNPFPDTPQPWMPWMPFCATSS